MLIRARTVLTMDDPGVIENGAVATRDGEIVAVGRWEDLRDDFAAGAEEIIDLGERMLVPGFVNAHCHLDYSTLRHAILPPSSFSEWIGRINALKRQLDQDDYLAAIARGFAEFRRWGVTTLLNVESFPELMWKLPAPPLRTWWFLEMIDVRSPVATEQLVAGALLFFQKGSSHWLGGSGLSPHAPYTASTELYRLARDCARRNGMPWTTHLGESSDEQRMFIDGQGPLYGFLKSIGRPMDDCGHGRSALSQLTAAGALGPECIAVHLNEMEEADFALFAHGGPLEGMTVAHCPLSHRYFQHRAFPFERLRALGANLCVATDSPASDGSFSLLDELRALASAHPAAAALDPAEMLAFITRNPARALGLEGRLGCIRVGSFADLAAFPDEGGAERTIHARLLGQPRARRLEHDPWTGLNQDVYSEKSVEKAK